MQSLINIIVAIFGLARATYDNIDLDEARDFHARYIARSIWLLTGLILIMIGINYAGYKEVNIFISLFLCLVVLTITTRPEPLVATVVAGLTSGIIQRPQTIIQEVRHFLFLFFRSLGDVVFWISIFGMFLGTISCKGNPGAVAVIAIALVVIGYGSYRWKMGPVLYKRVIYSYAIFIFLFSLASLPSHATWIHYAKVDPINILHASNEEDELAEVEKASAKKESDANIEILKGIKKDIKDGKDLKQWQIDFLEEMKRKRDNNSIPSRVADTFSSISLPSFGKKDSEYVPPAPAQAPAPTPAPAPIVQIATKTEEAANLSGRFQVCLNDSCSNFDLWQSASIRSKSTYPDGRKIVLEINETAPNVFDGSLLEEKRPPTYEDMRWIISELRFESKNGKVFGSGHFESPSGSTGVITVKKIS